MYIFAIAMFLEYIHLCNAMQYVRFTYRLRRFAIHSWRGIYGD
jgi:hypothetical protein